MLSCIIEMQICMTEMQICITEMQICITEMQICITEMQICIPKQSLEQSPKFKTITKKLKILFDNISNNFALEFVYRMSMSCHQVMTSLPRKRTIRRKTSPG
jgi:hypothetical protein